MAYIRVLAAIALLGSIAWLIAAPGFEAGLAVVGSLSALISASFVETRTSRAGRQQQSVGNFSSGVQAGGDVTMRIGDKGGGKDAQ